MARERNETGRERVAMVLLYDPFTGAIVHVHYAAADSGAELPGRQAMERQAVAHAKQSGGTVRKGVALDKLPRLHVDPCAFSPDRAYRIDVRTRTLVSIRRERRSQLGENNEDLRGH